MIKKNIHTPETVTGGCMTGKAMSDAEAKKVSSYIAQYRAKKKANSLKK